MKKPNKTQRYYLGCVWFFLFVLAGDSLLNFSGAAEERSVGQNGTGTLLVEISTETEESGAASRCLGTYIAENSLLTAAHCFDEDAEQFVRIKCSGHKWQAVRIVDVKKHPEMDVAFAHLSNIDCDHEQINVTQPFIGHHVYLYKDGKQKAMTIVSIDAFTFKVNDTTDCLIKGDSGVMAYAAPMAVAEKKALGILIAGQPTCPAIQTFLRFDLINEWLFSENII